MLIYRDIITKDEVLSDSFKITLVDDIVLEVETKYISLTEQNDFDIGANESAEEASESLESGSKNVIELVNNHNLCETSFDKKGFMSCIKVYMGKIKEHLQATNPDRIPAFQAGAQTFVKKVLAEFGEYAWYQGESQDPDAMPIACRFSEDGMQQKFYFWKDGLKEEKV
eukprot:NODE_7398_length_769_cov_261.346749_g7156_i0.p1 GENE.NODE_7398_length_769_cov_261.346749_g7156_i0~~NODE_7398_length_769_cov_261.346749_g7156_i0.p1  ORF type:complete len:195 (-),score=78.44 NODE_7398_length_769_cov_261.346749_g7156_i0:184-690(-)